MNLISDLQVNYCMKVRHSAGSPPETHGVPWHATCQEAGHGHRVLINPQSPVSNNNRCVLTLIYIYKYRQYALRIVFFFFKFIIFLVISDNTSATKVNRLLLSASLLFTERINFLFHFLCLYRIFISTSLCSFPHSYDDAKISLALTQLKLEWRLTSFNKTMF